MNNKHSVLVIGSGGREHAITWKLLQSPLVERIYVAPGNPGIGGMAECVPIPVDNLDRLVAFAREHSVDLTVVGPEYPLSLGIVDRFREQGLRVYGPTQAAAQLESSKNFAKEIMVAAGVPTAKYKTCRSITEALDALEESGAPVVLKADGLAAGKGVIVCFTIDEAREGINRLFRDYPGQQLVVEEFLAGVEASFIIATDGQRIVPMASAHDYKRALTGDRGPNTGGMGCVSPTPRLTPAQTDWCIEHIIAPVLREFTRRGITYTGFMYAGLMIDPRGGIRVLEFNARLGDPETQVILPRLEGDFFELLWTLSAGPGSAVLPRVTWKAHNAVCVVLAAAGYPDAPQKGAEILDHGSTAAGSALVFHAGTARNGSSLVVSGGRVLNVVGTGGDLAEARRVAYQRVKQIEFAGSQYREDIGV